MVINLLLFSILPFINVQKVKADQLELDTVLGAIINSSQGGRGGIDDINLRSFGSRIGGERAGGRRLGNAEKRGRRLTFKPTAVNMDDMYAVYIDTIFDANLGYQVIPGMKFDYYHYADINRYLIVEDVSRNIPAELYGNGYWGEAGNESPIVIKANSTYNYLKVFGLYRSPELNLRFYDYHNIDNEAVDFRSYSGGNGLKIDYTSSFNKTFTHSLRISPATFQSNRSVRTEWGFEYIVLSNVSDFNLDDVSFVHNPSNYPTKNEFIKNYSNTFNVEYDYENNQFVENDITYTYDYDDFITNNINNEYIINNYITYEGDNIGEQLNYTSLLERLINAVKDLPGQIAELVSFDFTQENEAGTNLWDVLQSLIDGILNLGTTILQSLIDGLSGLLEMLLNLLIPTEEQTLEIKNEFEIIQNNFTHKFEQVNTIGDSMSDIYSNRKSVYDLTYKFGDKEIHIIPVSLQAEVSFFRNLFSASILVMTLIEIYKRIVGRDDLIK